MAIEAFPTASDIGGSGAGRIGTEENIVEATIINQGQSTILSGMEPSDGGGLTVTIASGQCYIDGYIVRLPSSEDVTLSDDSTGYLWLQLTGSGSYAVTATAWIETADLSSPPTSSALVTKYITSGGSISSVVDRERREGTGTIGGTYTGNGSYGESQEIIIGLTPRLVVARFKSATANDNYRWAMSNIFPGNVEWPDFDEENIGQRYLCARFEEVGFDDLAWIYRGDEQRGGIGIIPNGFIAYNESENFLDGLGMNHSSHEYVYLAWF